MCLLFEQLELQSIRPGNVWQFKRIWIARDGEVEVEDDDLEGEDEEFSDQE